MSGFIGLLEMEHEEFKSVGYEVVMVGCGTIFGTERHARTRKIHDGHAVRQVDHRRPQSL